MTWQPIETAPRGKQLILYFPATDRNKRNYLPELIKVDHVPGDGAFRHPTHWMPLPEPPQ